MQVNLHIRRTRSNPSRFVFLIFFLLMLILYFVLNFLPKRGYSQVSLPRVSATEHAAIKLPPLDEHREIIPSGKSLSDLLEIHRFSAAQIHRMREDVKPVYDLARIKAGQELRIYSFEDGTVVALE